MSNIVVEHLMLLPLMIVVVILFSAAANSVAATYINQQLGVIAESALNQLTSTIQQLYYSLNQETIVPCNVTVTKPLPEKIDTYTYDVSATVKAGNELTLSLFVPNINIQVNKTINLSPNAQWSNSQFYSISPTAAIKVQKLGNGTLLFRFI